MNLTDMNFVWNADAFCAIIADLVIPTWPTAHCRHENEPLLLPTPEATQIYGLWSPLALQKASHSLYSSSQHCIGEVGWKKEGSQNNILCTDGGGEALQACLFVSFTWRLVLKVQLWHCGLLEEGKRAQGCDKVFGLDGGKMPKIVICFSKRAWINMGELWRRLPQKGKTDFFHAVYTF